MLLQITVKNGEDGSVPINIESLILSLGYEILYLLLQGYVLIIR